MRFETSVERRLTGRHKACLSMEDYRGKRVLDVGCSFGWFEKHVDADEITALDLNESDLEIARKECASRNVRFLCGSVLNLGDLAGDDFDVAVMFDVIEHIPEGTEVEALKEIRGTLRVPNCFFGKRWTFIGLSWASMTGGSPDLLLVWRACCGHRGSTVPRSHCLATRCEFSARTSAANT